MKDLSKLQELFAELDYMLTQAHNPFEDDKLVHRNASSQILANNIFDGDIEFVHQVYYLSDGGYSRLAFGHPDMFEDDSEKGKLWLTSNSLRETKIRWENTEVRFLCYEIEQLIKNFK